MTSKKKKLRKAARARCITWPPKEWPEEQRREVAAAAHELFNEIVADFLARHGPLPPRGEVIPFPEKRKPKDTV